MARNERTLQFMKEVKEKYLQGEPYVIHQLADEKGIASSTAYRVINEVAAELGVEREELLERNFIADHSGQNYTKVKPIDRSGFKKAYSELINALDDLGTSIHETIEESELTEQLYEEEYKGEK